ncbi:MAG: hypothetical protein U0802_09075 [Candidatus Binatia bacterium]
MDGAAARVGDDAARQAVGGGIEQPRVGRAVEAEDVAGPDRQPHRQLEIDVERQQLVAVVVPPRTTVMSGVCRSAPSGVAIPTPRRSGSAFATPQPQARRCDEYMPTNSATTTAT